MILSSNAAIAEALENTNCYRGNGEVIKEAIKFLLTGMEVKDEYTQLHSLRVSKYSYIIAKELGLSEGECQELKLAAVLHDIGKIGIRSEVLLKEGRLTDKEFDTIKEHPTVGSNILDGLNFSDNIIESVKYHHKRYDLKGYPYESNIKKIPVGASIIGVADAYDAMTTSRPYRRAMSYKEARIELMNNRGTQFDPFIVDALVRLL